MHKRSLSGHYVRTFPGRMARMFTGRLCEARCCLFPSGEVVGRRNICRAQPENIKSTSTASTKCNIQMDFMHFYAGWPLYQPYQRMVLIFRMPRYDSGLTITTLEVPHLHKCNSQICLPALILLTASEVNPKTCLHKLS